MTVLWSPESLYRRVVSGLTITSSVTGLMGCQQNLRRVLSSLARTVWVTVS